MTSYDYRGYVIFEDEEGYFIVDNCEFTSFDEACEWIDDFYRSIDTQDGVPTPWGRHTYHIFYVTTAYDQGYDDFVIAYNEREAIQILRDRYPDIAYIADCYEVD